MKTFVTLLSTANYLPGVLALNESLRRTGTRYPLLVALSCNTPVAVEATLVKLGIAVTRFEDSIEIPEFQNTGNGHWGNTFDKIQLFGLANYEKLVYLDSDMMVLQNIDELFKRPHMSAVAAGKMLDPTSVRLNSGIMVIEPKAGIPELIAQRLDTAIHQVALLGVNAIGDQDLINAYYEEWTASPNLHLPDSYNVFQFHIDEYIDKKDFTLGLPGAKGDNVIKIVHFIGAVKPWMKGARFKHFVSCLRRRGNALHLNKMFHRYVKLLNEVRYSQSPV
jgi:glycogenin glucosyltransferase